MLADTDNSMLTRVEFYERIWNTPMGRLAEEWGMTRDKLVSLCAKHDIPRPSVAYWTSKNRGKTPERQPLPETSSAPSIVVIQARQKITPRSVLLSQAIEEAKTRSTMPEVVGLLTNVLTVADGEARDPERLSERTQAILDAMKIALRRRGYKTGDADPRDGKGPWALIQGERVYYWVAEAHQEERYHYTKKDLKERPYLAGGRGWERRYSATGRLCMSANTGYGFCGGGGSDQKGRPLEAILGETIVAMEVIAGWAAERTRKDAEVERQAQLRRREKERRENREYEIEMRWERLAKTANEWHQAQRVRTFLTALKEAAADDKRLARRVAIWEAWAEDYIWHYDPLPDDPEAALRRLARPRRKRYEHDDEDDI